MNYFNELKKDKWKLASLLLLLALVAMSIYIVTILSNYFEGKILIAAIVGIVVLVALLAITHYKFPKSTLVIELLLIAICIFASSVLGKVDEVAENISEVKEYEVVQIVAHKDSGITSEDDFSSYVLGYVNSDNDAYERSSEILAENSKVVSKSRPYKTTDEVYSSLLSKSIELMVLTNDTKVDLSMIDEDYSDKIVVLFEKQYEIEQVEADAVDISTEPFTVYFQGTDLSSGDNISSTGRGDVNILLTVNPVSEQVYLQVIPRDTFVYIPCRGGSSKLSYSGWWGGVQSSIKSIEDKFDIKINYYAKINFNGLTDLVDALGGVEVYSHYTYESHSYYFQEGYNYVDGDQALVFARTRKILPQNELSRGQHQMELIKGIFKKFAENPTYDNAMSVIDSLSSNFITNIPKEDYYDVFSLVVKLLPELQNMENHSITGEYQWHYDEVRPTYYQYYYYPEESEIERVRNNIQAILDGKIIE